jgi:hypothetical protein
MRDSLHRGSSGKDLCRHEHSLALSSGIARYDVAARGTAAMAQNAVARSPALHCAHSTKLRTTIALTSQTIHWRNFFRRR